MRNVRKCKVGSNIAKHAWDNDHAIDFDNCKVIDRANFRHRGTLELWHTAMTINADNSVNNIDSYCSNCSHIFLVVYR